MLYRLLFRLLISRLDAERAHHQTIGLLEALGRFAPVRALLRRVLPQPDAVLASRVMGLDFPSPVGMAAGFDKDARTWPALREFGFGFVEVGTVTGQPQPGNPQPRLFRLPADRALINRMGFNNEGAQAVAARLDRQPRRRGVPLGVNIGKTKVVAAEDAAADYVASTRALARHADYLVVNVSSPNTPGLRDLQAVESLRPLLSAVVGAAPEGLPVLVKIAPDLADEDVDRVADLAVELGLAGIIATNTTIRRDGLRTRGQLVDETGGLSGAPLKSRAVEVLARLHRRVGDQLVLISVGGIETADEVWDRLAAGASLVQAYTAVVYGGPAWASRINRQLADRARVAGLSSITDLVGSESVGG